MTRKLSLMSFERELVSCYRQHCSIYDKLDAAKTTTTTTSEKKEATL